MPTRAPRSLSRRPLHLRPSTSGTTAAAWIRYAVCWAVCWAWLAAAPATAELQRPGAEHQALAGEGVLFTDDFESGDLSAWAESTAFAVTSVTPAEGTAGSELVIDGQGFRSPTVRLAGDVEAELEVLEVAFDRLTARLAGGLPAGEYELRVEEPTPLFDPLADDPFAVVAPSDLEAAPTFVGVGAEVVLGGRFLGTEAGSIGLRPRLEPGSTPVDAPVLAWDGTADGSLGEARFAVPFEVSRNGLHDVVVSTAAGEVVLPSGLVVTGVADGDVTGIRVVSAVATSSTEVLVQFNEAVEGGPLGAENPAFYRITADAHVPTLVVLGAELILPSLQTVRLLTLEQTDLLYTVAVSNVRDLAGNAFAEPTFGDPTPNAKTFWGLPPNVPTNADSDGDGLTDREEQLGWWVHVRRSDDSMESRHVTSNPGDPRLDKEDPFNVAARDTDADGLEDLGEKQAGTDPRTADTDADALGDDEEWNVIYSDPLDQDTDLDGAEDGFEFLTLKTSPILDDTDGDQFLDFDEVFAGNRDPLISDLPAPLIRVGSANLALDTRFEFTDESGQQSSESKTSSTALSRGEDTTYATSDERSTLETLETSQSISASVGVSVPPDLSFEAEFSSSQGLEQGSTFTVDESSGRSSEQAYEDSLSLESSFDVRETVTRSIEGATVKVDVTIESAGDVPFTISNLELSAQTQNPSNRRQLLPVASLVPENPDLDEINIGALGDPARGPFVFTAVSVFPQQVEELMKNPRGLLVSLANFDITDEAGRNFSFISQDVLDRTAGLTFDLGDGRVESYRVATASVHDRQTGRPAGITMRYALQQILGLYGVPTVRDGGDGVAGTTAAGDDVQLVAAGAAVEPGGAVISAGADGVLDSLPAGDDFSTPADYETARPQGNQVLDGGDGVADTPALGDDDQVVAPGDPVTPGEVVVAAGADGVLDSVPAGDDEVAPESGAVLTRYKDVATGFEDDPATPEIDERRRFWALYTSKDLPPNANLEDLVLRAGDELNFAFVQDQDGDEVMAREEFLHGSSDLFVNTDGCPPGDVCSDSPIPDRTTPPPHDLLGDVEEIQQGWRVRLAGSPQSFPVFPNPAQGDSDRDLLADGEERACGLDPRQRDTDLDGLSDWEELTGQRIVDGEILQMVSRDPDTDAIVFTIVPYTGEGEGPLLFHETLPACDALPGVNGFATDPLDPDTDGDQVSDFAELQLGIHPNNPFDGGDFLDDDGDGVSNNREQAGFTVGVGCGASAPPSCLVTFTSNPNDPDSDDDTLPDLLEHFLGSNPLAADTDGDSLADNDEYRGQGEACLTVIPGEPCVLFGSLIDGDFLDFVAQCDAAPNCTYDEGTLLAGREQYGTNMNEADSDFDTAGDAVELLDELVITVDGMQQVLPAPASDPLLADTDGEGLDDAQERGGGTDPRRADTDVDGVDDFREGEIGTDPKNRDRLVDFTWPGVVLTKCDDGVGDSHCELQGEWKLQSPDGTELILVAVPEFLPGIDASLAAGTNLFTSQFYSISPFGTVTRSYILLPGESIRIFSEGTEEVDSFSNDEVTELDRSFTLACDAFGCTLSASGTVTEDQAGDGVLLRSTFMLDLVN